MRQKKELINQTISRNLFWQLSDFWWNFSGRFVKTVFYFRVTFWWKAAFSSERLISNFFWHLAQTLKVLAKLLPAQLYKLLSTCLKGKKCEFQFLSKNFGFESFCKSSWFDGFLAKPHQFFSTNVWQCCQSCIQGVQMNNLWKILTWEKSFENDKIRGCLLKNLGQLSESFRQFRQNCILPVDSRF